MTEEDAKRYVHCPSDSDLVDWFEEVIDWSVKDDYYRGRVDDIYWDALDDISREAGIPVTQNIVDIMDAAWHNYFNTPPPLLTVDWDDEEEGDECDCEEECENTDVEYYNRLKRVMNGL